jgi:hypothetical protein
VANTETTGFQCKMRRRVKTNRKDTNNGPPGHDERRHRGEHAVASTSELWASVTVGRAPAGIAMLGEGFPTSPRERAQGTEGVGDLQGLDQGSQW